MSERITGYSLLLIGIVVMIFATIQIIFVFTGKAKPIPLFQYEKSENNNSENSSFNPSNLLNQFQGNSGQDVSSLGQLPNIQLIDPQVLNNMLNLTVYYLIMQFLLGLGFKLSSLGVQLLRPIQVNMKNRTLESISEQDNKTNS